MNGAEENEGMFLFRVIVEIKVMPVFVQRVNMDDIEGFHQQTKLFFFVVRIDCDARYESYTKDCVGSRINVERLAQSIRQLIIDTKVTINALLLPTNDFYFPRKSPIEMHKKSRAHV